MLIYMVTNRINGKRYIGQTIKSLERRKGSHISEALTVDDNSHFHRALRKHEISNFDWEIVATCDNRVKLNSLEIFYIGYYNTFLGEGYNLNAGGNGNLGFSPSVETRKKLSIANSGENNPMFGRKQSDESKKKMSTAVTGKRSGKNNVMFGKSHSDETRKKISAVLVDKYKGEKSHLFGKCFSEGRKKRMSVAMRGKYKGEKSPMFGKHLSEETKQKISVGVMGKYTGKRHHNAKAVIIGNKHFDTIEAASKFVGVSHSLIRKRIRHKTKWLDYHYT